MLEFYKRAIQKHYFEVWLSLQNPRLLKQMDDSEVHRSAFIVNTWVANNGNQDKMNVLDISVK